jgi:DNA mismatch repair protein MLH3
LADRKSPRRLERYPIYVLNIQVPTTELDAAYTPGKTVMGHQDEESNKKFLLAVVDEFLRRHEYTAPSKPKEVSEAPAGTPMMARTALVPLRPASTPLRTPQTPIVPRSVSALSGYRTSRLGFAQSVQSAPRVGEKRKMGGEMEEYRLDESGRKRYKWIEDILTVSLILHLTILGRPSSSCRMSTADFSRSRQNPPREPPSPSRILRVLVAPIPLRPSIPHIPT